MYWWMIEGKISRFLKSDLYKNIWSWKTHQSGLCMFSYYVINTNKTETKTNNKYIAQSNTTECGFQTTNTGFLHLLVNYQN